MAYPTSSLSPSARHDVLLREHLRGLGPRLGMAWRLTRLVLVLGRLGIGLWWQQTRRD